MPSIRDNTPLENILGFTLGVLVVLFVVGLLFTLGWNLGLTALIGTFGVTVGKISFIQGVFSVIGLAVTSAIIRAKPVNNDKETHA